MSKRRRTIPDEWAIVREFNAKHKAAVERKYQRIGMYNAILESWDGRDDVDEVYIRDVRRRLHQAQTQLKAMKP